MQTRVAARISARSLARAAVVVILITFSKDLLADTCGRGRAEFSGSIEKGPSSSPRARVFVSARGCGIECRARRGGSPVYFFRSVLYVLCCGTAIMGVRQKLYGWVALYLKCDSEILGPR